MQKKKHRRISPYADRMGRFIGQLRDQEGLTLKQLSRGLCGYLNRIENGEREAGKLIVDAFFQRLGKPIERFDRLLDHEEFVKWTQRQEIISHLRAGNADQAKACAQNYQIDKSCVLDRQFLAIAAINCCALDGMPAQELLPLVTNALLLTQPDFGKVPFDTLLLSQNEGRLLLAYLQLREELDGSAAVAEDYRTLLRYFKHPRYDSRERVYLFSYIACRVVENDYREGNYSSALAVCKDALSELAQEQRLFAYAELLAWKQKLFDATGNPDRTPGYLSETLKSILRKAPKCAQLLVPCEEQGHVYCINQVIRSRRALLGFSQEELSDEACGLRSMSRIENEDRKLQRKNRKLLLQKVNMSGERYDYEIISERYEDYLLRSELDRAIAAKDLETAGRLLSILRKRAPDIPTNRQYILKKEIDIRSRLPKGHPEKLTLEEEGKLLEEAIHLTIPLDFERVDCWPIGMLTINEILTLMMRAVCYKNRGSHQKSLAILLYIKKCMDCSRTTISYCGDLYARLAATLANALNCEQRYREAEAVSSECVTLALESQTISHLSRYLCSVAYNIEAQFSSFSAEEREVRKQEAFRLHEQAYAVAVILNDCQGQQHIQTHCEKMYGKRIHHGL